MKKLVVMIALGISGLSTGFGQGYRDAISGKGFTKYDLYKWLEDDLFHPKYDSKRTLETEIYRGDERIFKQLSLEISALALEYKDGNTAPIETLYKEITNEYGVIDRYKYFNWLQVYYALSKLDLEFAKAYMKNKPIANWKPSDKQLLTEDNFPPSWKYKPLNLFDTFEGPKSMREFQQTQAYLSYKYKFDNLEYFEGIISAISDKYMGDPSGEAVKGVEILYEEQGVEKSVWLKYELYNSIEMPDNQYKNFKYLMQVGRKVRFAFIWNGGNHVGVNQLVYINAL